MDRSEICVLLTRTQPGASGFRTQSESRTLSVVHHTTFLHKTWVEGSELIRVIMRENQSRFPTRFDMNWPKYPQKKARF